MILKLQAFQCHTSQVHAPANVFTVVGSHTSFPLPTFNFMEGWESAVFLCYLQPFDNAALCCHHPCLTTFFVPFHLINIVLLLDFPPCFAACDEQLNSVTVKRVAVLWQHLFHVEVVVLGCCVQTPPPPLLFSYVLVTAVSWSYRCRIAKEATGLTWKCNGVTQTAIFVPPVLVDAHFTCILYMQTNVVIFLNDKSLFSSM